MRNALTVGLRAYARVLPMPQGAVIADGFVLMSAMLAAELGAAPHADDVATHGVRDEAFLVRLPMQRVERFHVGFDIGAGTTCADDDPLTLMPSSNSIEWRREYRLPRKSSPPASDHSRRRGSRA